MMMMTWPLSKAAVAAASLVVYTQRSLLHTAPKQALALA